MTEGVEKENDFQGLNPIVFNPLNLSLGAHKYLTSFFLHYNPFYHIKVFLIINMELLRKTQAAHEFYSQHHVINIVFVLELSAKFINP